MKQTIKQLPTLSKILGIENYDVTRSQLHDLVALALSCGIDAAKKKAMIFENINHRKLSPRAENEEIS